MYSIVYYYSRRMGSHLNCSHILNIHQQSSPKDRGNLYLSSVYCLDNTAIKKDFEINSVLSIIDEWSFEKFKVKEKINILGIQHHKWINLHDLQQQSIYPYFNESHNFIKSNLQKNNVLVHCQMGVSRSSTLVIAFIMKQFGLSLDKARALTQRKRDIICPNSSFQKDLLKLHHELHKK